MGGGGTLNAPQGKDQTLIAYAKSIDVGRCDGWRAGSCCFPAEKHKRPEETSSVTAARHCTIPKQWSYEELSPVKPVACVSCCWWEFMSVCSCRQCTARYCKLKIEPSQIETPSLAVWVLLFLVFFGVPGVKLNWTIWSVWCGNWYAGPLRVLCPFFISALWPRAATIATTSLFVWRGFVFFCCWVNRVTESIARGLEVISGSHSPSECVRSLLVS